MCECGQFYWRSLIRNQSLIRVSDNLHFPSIIAVELSEYDVCHMLDWLIMMTSSNETFLALLALCEGQIHRLSVDSSHNGQWRETSMFSLISATTNGWPNNRCVGDLRRHPGHYDTTVMTQAKISLTIQSLYDKYDKKCLRTTRIFLPGSRFAIIVYLTLIIGVLSHSWPSVGCNYSPMLLLQLRLS